MRHDGTGLFEGVPRDAFFYFVHSFAPSECSDPCVATTDYGDKFASASVGENVWAVQFHPEKSSDVGYRVVQNFVAFAGKRQAQSSRHRVLCRRPTRLTLAWNLATIVKLEAKQHRTVETVYGKPAEIAERWLGLDAALAARGRPERGAGRGNNLPAF